MRLLEISCQTSSLQTSAGSRGSGQGGRQCGPYLHNVSGTYTVGTVLRAACDYLSAALRRRRCLPAMEIHTMATLNKRPSGKWQAMVRKDGRSRDFVKAYALTELVQWLFRSVIRVGGLNKSGRAYQPRRRVTLFMPSERMRNLLLNWLLKGRVIAGPVKPKGPKQIELLARLEGRQRAAAA